MGSVIDGLTSTILCIEDSGRAHPNAGIFASLSTRPAAIAADTVQWTGGTTGGRRMYAWADPDSGTNGVLKLHVLVARRATYKLPGT
jgi:hypothetical protein